MRLGSAVGPYSRRAGWLCYPLPCCLRRPRSAGFTSILLYPTGGALRCAELSVGATGRPRPWSCWWRCAAAQKNPIRRRTPKRAWSNEKQTRKSWLQPGQGTTRPGQDGGWQKVRRGDARAKIARSSDCCVPQVVCCVWVSLLRYRYLGFVVFLKGDFECCESC